MAKTKPSEKLRTAQELCNVEDIQGKILWTRDKYQIGRAHV